MMKLILAFSTIPFAKSFVHTGNQCIGTVQLDAMSRRDAIISLGTITSVARVANAGRY